MLLNSPYPWQEQQWQQLQQRRTQNNLPHALLLTGQAGLGKLEFAEQLATSLLCTVPSPDGKSCYKCKHCLLIKAGTHPDYHVLQPEAPSKIIKVDQIRQLIDVVAKTSQLNSYKVVIIEPAEAMNIASANALLKTLEEPAGRTHLFLISHQASSIPATLRSRCQIITFHPVFDEAAKLLLMQEGLAEGDAQKLLSYTEGAPLRALRMYQTEQVEQCKQVDEGLQALIDKRQDPITLAASFKDIEFSSVITWMTNTVMDLIRQKNGADSNTLVKADCDITKLYSFLDNMLAVRDKLIRGLNLNQQLLLEDLLYAFGKLASQGRGHG